MTKLLLPLLWLCIFALTSFGQKSNCRQPLVTPSISICQLDSEMSPLFPNLGADVRFSIRVPPLDKEGEIADMADQRIAKAKLTAEKDGLVSVRKTDFVTRYGVKGIKIFYEYKRVFKFAGEEVRSHEKRIEYLFDSSNGQVAFVVFRINGESDYRAEQVANDLVEMAVIK